MTENQSLEKNEAIVETNADNKINNNEFKYEQKETYTKAELDNLLNQNKMKILNDLKRETKVQKINNFVSSLDNDDKKQIANKFFNNLNSNVDIEESIEDFKKLIKPNLQEKVLFTEDDIREQEILRSKVISDIKESNKTPREKELELAQKFSIQNAAELDQKGQLTEQYIRERQEYFKKIKRNW